MRRVVDEGALAVAGTPRFSVVEQNLSNRAKSLQFWGFSRVICAPYVADCVLFAPIWAPRGVLVPNDQGRVVGAGLRARDLRGSAISAAGRWESMRLARCAAGCPGTSICN